MPTYEFTLRFDVTPGLDVEEALDALFDEERGDYLVGFGSPGKIAIAVTCDAPAIKGVVREAIAGIVAAVPDARLVQIVRHRDGE